MFTWKHAFVVMSLVFCLTTFCVAQNTTLPPGDSSMTKSGLTVQDAEKIKEGYAAIQKFLGTNPLDTAGSHVSTNFAEVADKALDMVGRAVGSISATLQKVAPEVWRIMIRQQYAKAISEPIAPLLWLILCIIWYKFTTKKWTPDVDEGDDDNTLARIAITKGLPTIGAAVAGGFLIFAVKTSILLAMNPEYYAIKDLFTMILKTNPGM